MNHDKSGCNGVSVPLGNLLMVLATRIKDSLSLWFFVRTISGKLLYIGQPVVDWEKPARPFLVA